jgi:hypothetical protein
VWLNSSCKHACHDMTCTSCMWAASIWCLMSVWLAASGAGHNHAYAHCHKQLQGVMGARPRAAGRLVASWLQWL